jgi:hypothetical protein
LLELPAMLMLTTSLHHRQAELEHHAA